MVVEVSLMVDGLTVVEIVVVSLVALAVGTVGAAVVLAIVVTGTIVVEGTTGAPVGPSRLAPQYAGLSVEQAGSSIA